MKDGLVFRIQKFSIHDGPGIRTTVFLKGCPLKCWWCHNPEGQDPLGAVIYHKERCIKCEPYYDKCIKNELINENDKLIINHDLSEECNFCIDECPGNALELIGKKKSVKEIIDLISKDIIFYDESGGGVTFSGGEPLMQPEFLIETLKECKRRGINTAVDTSGFASWNILNEVSKYTDLFLYDLKFIDEQQHIKYTGVSGLTILSNLEKLAKIHSNIFIRVPIIPGINDNIENFTGISSFMKKINLKNVNILPYHYIGSYKYKSLGMEYKLEGLKSPTNTEMQNIAKIFSNYELQTIIGG